MAGSATRPEVQLFREYLQIPSVHPNVDYSKNILKLKGIYIHLKLKIIYIEFAPFSAPCIQFIQRQATLLSLPTKIVHPANPQKPVIILSWIGSRPELPSIVLNSHMDVVPVVEQFWTQPPFGAHIDELGRIYARGSQDMKCVPIQQLTAICALKTGNYTPKRTIHMTFVPGNIYTNYF